MKPFDDLTARQQEFLVTGVGMLCRFGRMPNIRSWGNALGIYSPNGAMSHIHLLARFGWLTSKGNETARCWSFTPAALAWFRTVEPTPEGIRLRMLAPEVTLTLDEARDLGERLLSLANHEENHHA